ncbi:MAG: hypothetical protein NTV42_01975 [Chloroflexi bacterium]|nr:hypothetical protein [Chloroflexota bacterium]
MKYRYKRHISNTLLYALIITALIALTKEYSVLWAVVFGIIGTILLAIDRTIENTHLREEEDREKQK